MKKLYMSSSKQFEEEVRKNIKRLGADSTLFNDSLAWMLKVGTVGRYTYNFRWLGRPIIQYPQDMVAIQELIWQGKPDLVIETGVAHGGSLMLSASMLALLDITEAIESGISEWNPRESKRKVLGIDIEIRPHNRAAIETHPMFSRIQMIEGSSIDQEVIDEVHRIASNYNKIMVFLDSLHTHDHVLAELKAYAPLVSLGSYCVVFDTLIEDMPPGSFPNRPWDKGNNPKTALHEYLRLLREEGRTGADGKPLHFEIDKSIENKLLITVAPDGYLKRLAR